MAEKTSEISEKKTKKHHHHHKKAVKKKKSKKHHSHLKDKIDVESEAAIVQKDDKVALKAESLAKHHHHRSKKVNEFEMDTESKESYPNQNDVNFLQ